MADFSVYVHIPFCLQKCPYCDFNTYALATFPEREYLGALLSELDYRATLPEWSGRSVQSVYFGGGTPSLFSAETISKIIRHINALFSIRPDAEISLEANPGNLSTELLVGFAQAGVNRISLGAQSFQERVLRALGRHHRDADIEAAVGAARIAGIANISLDLIFGAPDQTLNELSNDLERIAAVAPCHVSPYGLTIEKGTPFFTSHRKGILRLPPEAAVINMMEEIECQLSALGFQRYEISNYALPGFESRHNMAYWNGDDYLGLGAGAHSFNRRADPAAHSHGVRWANLALPQRYMDESTTRGLAESWRENLTLKDAVFELLFLGLRKTVGVAEAQFQSRFNISINSVYGEVLDTLSEEGLVERVEGSIRLSSRGRMLADSVIEQFASPLIAPAKNAHSRGINPQE